MRFSASENAPRPFPGIGKVDFAGSESKLVLGSSWSGMVWMRFSASEKCTEALSKAWQWLWHGLPRPVLGLELIFVAA